MHKKRIVILISLITLLILGIVGITYAYFTAVVTNGDKGSSIYIKTGSLKITYTDTEYINISNMVPGDSVEKLIRVHNEATNSVTYDLIWVELLNNFNRKSQLVYNITCASGCNGILETYIPSEKENVPIIKGQTITGGVTFTYLVTITLKETGSNQNENQGVSLKGKIGVIETGRYEDKASRLLTTAIFDANGTKATIEAKGDPDFSYTSPEIKYKESIQSSQSVNLDGSSQKYVSQTYTFDSATGKYQLVNPILVTYSNDYVDYYTVNNTTSETKAYVMYKINTVTSTNVVNADKYTQAVDSYTNQDFAGMYAALDDSGSSTYYYRGLVENNYVSFANKTWRIIRVNGDGSIRMILNDYVRDNSDQVSTINYNSNSNCAYGAVDSMEKSTECAKYGHGTYASNSISSEVEAWYDNNITGNANSLVKQDAIYCNDYSYSSYIYGSYYRLVYNRTPSLTCMAPNGYSGGEAKKLSLKVGLITADELSLAGGIWYNTYLNKSFYLYIDDQFWWSLSPYSWTSSDQFIYSFVSGRKSLYGSYVSNTQGIRPVINLVSSVIVTGDGTFSNPYNVIGD